MRYKAVIDFGSIGLNLGAFSRDFSVANISIDCNWFGQKRWNTIQWQGGTKLMGLMAKCDYGTVVGYGHKTQLPYCVSMD